MSSSVQRSLSGASGVSAGPTGDVSGNVGGRQVGAGSRVDERRRNSSQHYSTQTDGDEHSHHVMIDFDGVAEPTSSSSSVATATAALHSLQQSALNLNIALGGGGSESGHVDPDTPQPSGGTQQAGVSGEVDNAAQLQNSILLLVKLLSKSLEGVLPFLLLIFAKVMYDHRLGILVFVGLSGTFQHVNLKFRKLAAAQRETMSVADRLQSLSWLFFFLSANIFCIYYFFQDQQLYRALYFSCPMTESNEMTLWSMLWITGVTDFVVKFGTVLLKALVASLPRPLLVYKKKGKYYMLIEMLSQFYRSLLPIMPWIYFLLDERHGGQWFAIILLLLYALCKGYQLIRSFRELKGAFRKFRVDLSYGCVPSGAQLAACDNICPICQDKLTEPVMLSCKHIFCEDCVAMWFDRDRTCPMCRATITDNPQWRDGNTYIGLHIY